MTQEDKDLLLKDLCARLPYDVKAQVRINVKYSDAHKPNSETWIGDIWGITTNKSYTAWVYSFITIYPCGPEQNVCSIEDVKPYLRLMSSMTEEEREEFRKVGGVMSHNLQNDTWAISAFTPEAYDWLNSHHFDYRGLIQMGLALEAPEGMYEIQD